MYHKLTNYLNFQNIFILNQIKSNKLDHFINDSDYSH